MKQNTKYNALWPSSLSSFSRNPLNCAPNLPVGHASQFGVEGRILSKEQKWKIFATTGRLQWGEERTWT